jgi:hypothetical protein
MISPCVGARHTSYEGDWWSIRRSERGGGLVPQSGLGPCRNVNVLGRYIPDYQEFGIHQNEILVGLNHDLEQTVYVIVCRKPYSYTQITIGLRMRRYQRETWLMPINELRSRCELR